MENKDNLYFCFLVYQRLATKKSTLITGGVVNWTSGLVGELLCSINAQAVSDPEGDLMTTKHYHKEDKIITESR